MKILIWSCAFYPNLGGIERMTETLGNEFTRMGYKVTVVTRTAAQAGEVDKYPFTVVRRPSSIKLLRLVADCDVFIHNHLSLKVAFPLIVFHRPWLVVYQTWYPYSGFRRLFLPLVSRFATAVACSRAVAAKMNPGCLAIPNAYDDGTFRIVPVRSPKRQLVFVGRLIKDKGVHVLLDALSLLKAEGLSPKLTVVGLGPQQEPLVERANHLGLGNQVEFVGPKSGDELAKVLNSHEIMVVPSLWREPFGIVALEGIACGCVVVGSNGGGLSDAIGDCGVTFPNGDSRALAKALSELLRSPETWQRYRDPAPEHLRRHTATAVASAYLDALNLTATRRNVLLNASPHGSPSKDLSGQDYPSRPTKILLWTCSFYPRIGGIETMAEILGREFTAMGRRVTLVTRTPGSAEADARFPFKIVRSPSPLQLMRLVADCDVFVHNHLSMKVSFPLLFLRRPWMVVYHCEYPTVGLRGIIQPLVSRVALTVACSKALAEFTGPECRVLPNAYDDTVFKRIPGIPRDRDLVFVGRLISDKGMHVLLDALALLRREGVQPKLSVVGEGQDWDCLVSKTNDLNLTEQVEFVGRRAGTELAAILNRHRILVVPSLVRESFGIVALEAIACGCIVIGSESGGLKEAIGSCGITFPMGDASALAQTLSHVLLSPETWSQYYHSAADHVSRHTARAVAIEYLNAIEDLTACGRNSRDLVPSARVQQ